MRRLLSAATPQLHSQVSNSNAPVAETEKPTVVIVGNGPVGFRLLRELVNCQFHREAELRVFGEEPRPAYDRVNLTSYIRHQSEKLLQYEDRSWYEEHGVQLTTGDPVVEVDRQQKQVRTRSGVTVAYDQLVLATGSRPFIPPIPGIDHKAVFPYRTIDDLEDIRRFAEGRSRAVVLGEIPPHHRNHGAQSRRQNLIFSESQERQPHFSASLQYPALGPQFEGTQGGHREYLIAMHETSSKVRPKRLTMVRTIVWTVWIRISG